MRDASPPALGFVEWFRMGDHAHAEEAIDGMTAAGVTHLRTQLSWAEHHLAEGPGWYDWLLPRLSEAFDVMTCVHYTPPSLSRTGRSSGAPRRLRDYADFIDAMLTRHGAHIDAVELWNEPNNLLDWDWRSDPDHLLFCEMIGDAAYWVRERGHPVVLGGPCPFDAALLDLMGQRGLLDLVSAVGLHGFPGTWDSDEASWSGWTPHLDEARAVLARHAPAVELWITETGYSTWDHDEMEQLRRFREVRAAPADRLYWYSWRDLAPDVAVQEGLWFDPRHYHMGVVDAKNRPKLVARLLREGGLGRLDRVAALAAPVVLRTASRPVVITGGCGFIGTNLAESFLADGDSVVVLDNLSRPGVDRNLALLREAHGDRVRPQITDIRARSLSAALEGARAVFHLAGQTAVTTSLADPTGDFDVNARGTLALLEAVRATVPDAPVVFASTNKVYGDLADLALEDRGDRCLPVDPALRRRGVGEDRPLDFRTPYGCSKGVADQYVLDYAASFGLRTAVLRMSCIYGPHQFGTEDQGWVAHFLLRALAEEEITVFGDGRQVRDVLHVRDAVMAYRATLDAIGSVSGQAFNLGGGPGNAISLAMLLAEIGRLAGAAPRVRHAPTRAGDQRYFVADTTRLEQATGWRCGTGWRAGVAEHWDWLARNRFTGVAPALRPRRVRA
jgi:CDP-paratose 2-epimerase